MSNFDFPCRFEKLEDGTEIVRCRDLPELLSYSVDGEPLENWARYAVEDCVEFRIKDGELIPEASPALPGEYVVRLSANQVAKSCFQMRWCATGSLAPNSLRRQN